MSEILDLPGGVLARPAGTSPKTTESATAGVVGTVLPPLRMRPWSPADAADLLAAFGDPAIRHYSTTVVDTAADAAHFVALRALAWSERTGASWAIASDRGTVLGHVGVHVVDRALDTAVVGYWLLPRARGRAVAARAVRAGTAFAFRHLALHRIELAHAVENSASCRVAERAGFAYEGTLRDAMRYLDDRWSTEHLHARLVTDPDPATPD